jgi:hypothetical protein
MPTIARYLGIIVLVGPSFLFIGHFSYAVLHSDIYLYGTERFVRYYLAPLLLAAIYLFIVYRTSSAVRVQVGAYTYALFGALLMFELYPYWASADQGSSGKLNKIMELRAAGREAYPSFPVRTVNELIGGNSREDAIVTNLPIVTTVLCQGHDGEWVWFDADRDGFNNPPNAYSDGRVALIGDSFIHGECLPRTDDIVGQLRQRGLQPLNFGIQGHGPLLELETLKRYVQPHEPEDVVWCFYEGNDLDDLEAESQIRWLIEALGTTPDSPPPGPEQRQRVVQTVKAMLDQQMANGVHDNGSANISWTSVLAFRRFFTALGLHYGRATGPIDLLARVLRTAKIVVERWGGRLHFCYLPEYGRYAGLLPAQGAYNSSKNLILDLARDLDLNIIDVSVPFDQYHSPRDLFDEKRIHYAPRGAALVAEAIAEGLPP